MNRRLKVLFAPIQRRDERRFWYWVEDVEKELRRVGDEVGES